MNKKITLLISTLGFLAPVFIVSAAFNQTEWQFKKDISVRSINQPSYVKISLDKDVYAGSSNLNDLRVISGAGDEVPYQLVEQQNTLNARYYASNVLNNSIRGGKGMFIVDLGKPGLVHNRINISTGSTNFKKPVSVYASDSLLSIDDPSWRLLTQNQYIYNFSDRELGFNAGSGEVAYPKSTSRYLRIVIGEGEGEIVSVDNARVYAYEVVAGDQDTITASATITQNTEAKSTEALIDLGAAGIPTHALELASNDKNFNRRVVIQGSNDGSNWALLNQGYIFNVQTALFSGSQLSLQYPESYNRYIRVVIFNEDNKPINLSTRVLVKSTVRNVIFEAAPAQQYSLYYGNSGAPAPLYDLARLFQYIDTGTIVKSSLGNSQQNSAYVTPPPPKVPFTEQYPFLLNILLVVLVALIGGLVVFYVRKINK